MFVEVGEHVINIDATTKTQTHLVGSQTKLSSLHIATSLTPKHLSNGIQSIISSQQLILVEYMCSDVTHEEGVWVSDERQDCDGKST
jgi:hypothetical protein